MYTSTEIQKGYISAKNAGEITGRDISVIEELCRTGKVQSKVVMGEWYLSEDSLSKYFNLSLSSEIPNARLVQIQKDLGRVPFLEKPDFLILLGKVVNVLTAITLVFGGYYVTATYQGRSALTEVVSYVHRTLDASTDTMAFVGYGITGSFQGNNTANLFSSLKDFFRGQDIKAEIESGMVVVPIAQGDGEIDRVRKKIQKSFSDEIEVVSSGGGKSGIIKPVFKKAKGGEYLYVMVPLKE